MTLYHVGPQHSFTNINSALAIASTGDTILIEAGTYNEVLFMNNKVVNLIGMTDYPLENKIEIVGYNSYENNCTLRIKWESSTNIDILIEGIHFKCAYDSVNGVVYFDGDAGNYNTSGLNITFNKCVFDSTNFTLTNALFYYKQYYIYNYHNLNTFCIKNCDIYLAGNSYFVHGRFRDCYDRSMLGCRFNTTPKGYDASGTYIDVFPSGSFDYISTNSIFPGYGSEYSAFLNTDYPNFYKFSGVIKENGIPVSRDLRFFRKDNDVYIGTTNSNSIDGSYSMYTPYGGDHYIICLDSGDSPYYNDLIQARCFPSNHLPAAQIFTPNLELINPGLEMGDLTGWIIETGSNIISTNYKHSGNYSFGTGTVSQRVDLLGHGATVSGIDNEYFYFSVHAWKYYYYTDNYDINTLGIRLLDENESPLGSDVYNNNHAPVIGAWVEDTYTRPVVSGTRYVDILIKVAHSTGYTNYYNKIDDVSCYLSYSGEAPGCFVGQKLRYYTLINPNFEIGSIVGWSVESGTLNYYSSNGYDSSKVAGFQSTSSGVIRQRVNLSMFGLDLDLIDAESLVFFTSAQIRQSSASGWSNLGIRFLDATQTVLGVAYYSPTYTNTSFVKRTFSRTVVSGTRYVDVLFKGYYTYIDCVLLWSKEV